MKMIILLLPLLFTSCLKGSAEFVKENIHNAKTAEEEGAMSFIMNDFGALRQHGMESNILPFKVATAALLFHRGFDPETRSTKEELTEVFKSYGILVDGTIQNLPQESNFIMPEYMGIFKGRLHAGIYPAKVRIEGSGFSCASCHGGVTYNATGEPLTDSIYLGSPNTSINLEKYTSDVFKAFINITDKKDIFKEYLLKVYPKITRLEYQTISMIYKSEIVGKVRALENNLKRQTPMINGGAGLTNGVGSLKYQLGLITNLQVENEETGFTSVPVIYDRKFRNSLLYDGVYAPKVKTEKNIQDDEIDDLTKIVTFFTVATSANLPAVAETKFKQVKKVMQFLETAERPTFPGKVDFDKAGRGQMVYKNQCASCHGEYSSELSLIDGPKLISFPNKVTDNAEMKTDGSRLRVIDKKFIDTVNNSIMGKHLTAVKRNGYIAPILTSTWITAPYLHNGSVPSLWQLMNPKLRMKNFYVGGHKIDFETVGVDLPNQNIKGEYGYSEGYIPWSNPELYDTSLLGKGNSGHEAPFDKMTQEEKWEVIEYLKLI